MTLDEIKKLQVGDTVGYQLYQSEPIIDALVTQNGPRTDPEGRVIPHTNNLLVIQLGSGPGTVSWEPDNFPLGIPQLVKLEEAPAA
jgi:hypothetical protein